jgi:CheY-like chemotaxis protein
MGRTASASVNASREPILARPDTRAGSATGVGECLPNEPGVFAVRRAVRPLHFLVTDDDVDKRLLIGVALSKTFPTASVFECYSGKEALEYFSANHVDVIVTNHNMKPVDGIQLVRQVRQLGSDVPIIMVSGHDEMREQALAAGVDLFLDSRDMLGIGRLVAEFLRQRGVLPAVTA